MQFKRRAFLASTSLGLLTTPQWSLANTDTPPNQITIVVPYAPGASTDQLARLVQQKMQESTGNNVIVENKPGANGNIGAAYVANSKNNANRILLATQPILTINPFIYKNIGFDAEKDLKPLVHAVNAVVCIAVHPSINVKNVKELIEYAKREKGKASFGTAGSGSPQHIGGLIFSKINGFEWTHIPYKGGGPMVNDLLAGQIKVGIVTLSVVKGFADEGRLNIIAIGERKRFDKAPNISTISETVNNFELSTWLAFFTSKDTDSKKSEYFEKHLKLALNQPDVKEKLLASALPVVAGDANELDQLVKKDRDLYSKIIREENISAE